MPLLALIVALYGMPSKAVGKGLVVVMIGPVETESVSVTVIDSLSGTGTVAGGAAGGAVLVPEPVSATDCV